MPTSHDATTMDASTFRQGLLAPEPMPRVVALHALEAEIEHVQGGNPALVNAAARFVERGIPYYNVQDPHYQAWVSKAVSYWEKLHGGAALQAS